jgi:tRNA-uridine 2-sulfurtransferase
MINLEPLVRGKKIEDTTIVVAMSGGVDSSVVAALLKSQGYKVIGITLQLWDYSPTDDGQANKKMGTCCALDDVYDARRVCQTMGIDHYVLNYESDFKRDVIDDFVDTYSAGATPIPCVRCNERIKFDALLEKSKELGADALATGHYVQKIWNEELNKYTLLRGKEDIKDQSYFLFTTRQDQLDYTVYPLGMVENKDVTRQMAQDLGLHVSKKPDSQDICFVPNGDYRKIVKKENPEAFAPGNFVNTAGKVLGTHDGIINFTVGQRKGLGIALGEPMYVVEIKPDTKEVVLGLKEELKVRKFNIKDLNWIGEDIPAEGLECEVRVRNGHDPIKCLLMPTGTKTATVELFNPQAMVAPGQAAVFYNERRLIGGGWILNDTTKVKLNVTVEIN